MRTAAFIEARALEWVRAAGAIQAWAAPQVRRLSGYQHQAGTCRMGTDPARSVTDPFGRLWGARNVVVCDGSVHPTNGAFNPVLTILALSFRNASALVSTLGSSK